MYRLVGNVGKLAVPDSTFLTATHAIPVLRGTSACPLYVTAAGMLRTDPHRAHLADPR